MVRKVKKEREFYFSDYDKDEFIQLMNSEYPIKFNKHMDIINRIHERYPILSKDKISLIVIKTFECMRSFLLLGKVLNFTKFVFNMSLLFYTVLYKKISPVLKVKMTTSPSLRGKDKKND